MSSLEDAVRSVVDGFVKNSVLFTALDVSNAVKATHPLARHREVRDTVRGIYSDIQASGYGRTPIQVQLADGTQVEALLYHHLSDSWDLDTKYDDQKRAQSLVSPLAAITTPVATATPAPVPAPVVPSVSVVSNVPVAVTAPAVSVPPNTPVTITDPKQLWDSLFTGVKLFPRV